MPGTINGFTLSYTALGGILVWSGIKGATLASTFSSLLKGQPPQSGGQPIGTPSLSISQPSGSSSGTGSGSSGTVPGTSDARAALQQAAAEKGWGSGAQWTALQNVEMREAGFNPTARNPQSGAFGLAQALGHGTSGTAAPDGTNEYGGFGLSDAQAQAANSGEPGPQALWMVNYIAATYGTPEAAWAHEQSAGWY